MVEGMHPKNLYKIRVCVVLLGCGNRVYYSRSVLYCRKDGLSL